MVCCDGDIPSHDGVSRRIQYPICCDVCLITIREMLPLDLPGQNRLCMSRGYPELTSRWSSFLLYHGNSM
jgi:hypothetical protein